MYCVSIDSEVKMWLTLDFNNHFGIRNYTDNEKLCNCDLNRSMYVICKEYGVPSVDGEGVA